MPLLVSPMDNKTPMQQIRRDGVEFDRCPVSGGIWLDKGELEKLLSAVQNAASEDRAHYGEYVIDQKSRAEPYTPPRRTSSYHDDDDDYEGYHHKKYGKKSKLKSLFDIFD